MPLTKIVTVPAPPPIEEKTENRRIWIGNLDTNLSEYQLLKILEKHGRLEKFDLLFHRSGPLVGQPRGYAFVTYSSKEEAERMIEALDGKRIGIKNIAVRWAHNLNMEEREKQKVEIKIPALTGAKEETKVSRITKIQAIEAKLKMMENSSTSEFQLSDGPSGMSVPGSQRNVYKERNSKPFSRAKKYSKPYHKR